VKYDHSIERSAELLRLALPHMARQAAALHPVSYAVWYEYVAQDNVALRGAVDQQLARHGQLDESSTQALFRQHVSEIDPQAAQRVAEGLHRVLDNISSSAADAGDQTAAFGSSLSRLTEQFDHGVGGSALDELMASTHKMQNAMTVLESRLAESQREIEALHEEVKRARQASLLDGLTGLVNRRGFDQRLSTCIAEVALESSGTPPALVVGDIDHFKRINDTYGHAFGDQVLRAVAQVLSATVGVDGLAARIGGEEFALLLPGVPLDRAAALAEQIRGAIAAGRIQRGGEALQQVTLSFGVAAHRGGEGPREFLERTDRALYGSKASGRNRVTVAEAD
jgi:diguanylate cyclase